MQGKLTQSKEWTNLKNHYEQEMKTVHMRELFKDTDRFNKYSIRLDNIGILFDYSKNIIDDKTKQLLLDLVISSDLKSWTEKIFSGVKINWKSLCPAPVLISLRAKAYSSPVSGCKNTGKCLPTLL